MPCTCPICERTVEYPERYVGKWHRCAAGCTSTRMVIVPDGIGVSEDEVAIEWHEEVRIARISRAAMVACGMILVFAPFCDMFPRPFAVLMSIFGAAVVIVGLRQSEPSRPAGL